MPADTIATVGLLSPGDMGHSVGAVLHHHGMPVITCLDGRSERSSNLAAKAGIQPVDTLATLVQQADFFLSIVPPARAIELGKRIAGAIESTGTELLYLDCNAIAPETTREVGRIIESSGGTFIDGGIIGSPPKIDGSGPRIYVSGEHAGAVEKLRDFGLDIRAIGPRIGDASAVKMCYAAMTKGSTALATELLVAAEALGVTDTLRAEFESSQKQFLDYFERQIPRMPPKAYRWVGEMEEIAKTFEDTGMTPKILLGAADMYRLVGETPLADETPENRSQGETLEDVIAILNKSIA